MQLYDLSGPPFAITRGHFDPLDILAYTIGLFLIFVADILWLRPRAILPGERTN
jgi:hypothetical protein